MKSVPFVALAFVAFLSDSGRVALVIGSVGFIIAVLSLVLTLRQATKVETLAKKLGGSDSVPVGSR